MAVNLNVAVLIFCTYYSPVDFTTVKNPILLVIFRIKMKKGNQVFEPNDD